MVGSGTRAMLPDPAECRRSFDVDCERTEMVLLTGPLPSLQLFVVPCQLFDSGYGRRPEDCGDKFQVARLARSQTDLKFHCLQGNGVLIVGE